MTGVRKNGQSAKRLAFILGIGGTVIGIMWGLTRIGIFLWPWQIQTVAVAEAQHEKLAKKEVVEKLETAQAKTSIEYKEMNDRLHDIAKDVEGISVNIKWIRGEYRRQRDYNFGSNRR